MSEDIEPHILKRYEVVRRIGKGAYGIVIIIDNLFIRFGKHLINGKKIYLLL